MTTKLPKKFRKRTFNYSQVEETEKAYLYRVSDDNYHFYEIFMKKLAPNCVNFEERIYSDTDFHEVFPKDRDFGKTAWTTRSFDRAKIILNEKAI